MLKEALEYLNDRFGAGKAPVKIDTKDPRSVVHVINGVATTFAIAAPARDHKPAALVEVVALANRFAEAGAKPVVWYSGDEVVLVIDDDGGHRIEKASLTLEHSDVWTVLLRLRKDKPTFDPKRFSRLLRVDLAGTLEPVTLLNQVKRLKFTNSQTVDTHVGRGKESMGREINSEVSKVEDIPEVVTLATPVYKTPGEDAVYPVRCAVEIDPMEGTLQLLPIPDELERIEHMAAMWISERLHNGLSEGIPHYQGCP